MKRTLLIVCMSLVLVASVVVMADAADHKVDVCHKGSVISVAHQAVPAHEKHGDCVGFIPGTDGSCRCLITLPPK